MSAPAHDPVHRATYTFEPDGDDLWVETRLEPGGALPPHLHPRQEEHWSVLEGTVRFQLGSEKRVIGPADGTIVVVPGMKHGLESTGAEARLRCHVVPALELEEFLTESAAAAREGLFMRGGIPRGLRGARWAASFLKKHRDDVVMTFPPRFVQSAMIALLGR
jgi:mannose-6-phosphate isomerase-like protein (cupin superfamily)